MAASAPTVTDWVASEAGSSETSSQSSETLHQNLSSRASQKVLDSVFALAATYLASAMTTRSVTLRSVTLIHDGDLSDLMVMG